MPRTRFAPSPTGFLHIGNARTALFNWAFARRHRGTLVLRIEDTDRERSTRDFETALLDALRWLGIDWDEGPVRQSDHHARHTELVARLLAAGRAYRCVCTREELEARRQATIAAGGKWTYDGRCRDAGHGPGCGPHTVRLRMPREGRIEWDDLVYGPSGQDASEIGDVILQRTDGTHVYHLAVVADDLDARIDTVIRGADHFLNTCIHLGLYAALGVPPPRFAHVPLLVAADGKKLSKRRDAVAVEHFREAGYLPEAVRNWLARMGWSHGDREIFGAEDFVSLFDLADVHRSAAQVDEGKLQWLNQQWIKALPRERLLEAAAPFLAEVAGGPVRVSAELELLVDLLRERSRTLRELAERARFALRDAIEFDEAAVRKHLTPEAAGPLRALRARLADLAEWSEPALERAFEDVRLACGDLPLGKLAQPVRVAVTGSAASPPIYETLRVLGRERSLRRLGEALARAPAATAG
jgi:glutamyl-tRNA synthetase